MLLCAQFANQTSSGLICHPPKRKGHLMSGEQIYQSSLCPVDISKQIKTKRGEHRQRQTQADRQLPSSRSLSITANKGQKWKSESHSHSHSVINKDGSSFLSPPPEQMSLFIATEQMVTFRAEQTRRGKASANGRER